MLDPRTRKLAKQIVNYCVTVKKGDNVYISASGFDSDPLVRELITEVIALGATPFTFATHSPFSRRFLQDISEEQVKAYTDVYVTLMEQMDCFISIAASLNSFELADVPQEKMKMFSKQYVKRVINEIITPNTRWLVIKWPVPSIAQKAKMSTEAFEDFYFDVCTVDYAKMSKAMDPLVKLMESTDRVRITSPGTDLTFSIKGIPVVKCDGKMNVPDGEVFTAPVKDSVNGVITYNTPSTREGISFDKVKLTFKDGKIIEATAASDVERLNKIFDVDEGARYVGEFAIGVNPRIFKPMDDILFDEKIAGSLHFTPGKAYDDADNGNESTLHWDLVLIQREDYGGGEIFFDDVLIRKDGIFVLDELKGLNPENLL